VNQQIASLGIKNLTGNNKTGRDFDLQPDDVVIVPAFGTELVDLATNQGSRLPDCRYHLRRRHECLETRAKYASESATSIIHGKAEHEETKADKLSRARRWQRTLSRRANARDTDYVCEYVRHGGDSGPSWKRFRGAHSSGFDPDVHLQTVGVANQTTMLRGEYEEVQRRIRQAIVDRDGPSWARTISFLRHDCGATQDGRTLCGELLDVKMDLLLVVGGFT